MPSRSAPKSLVNGPTRRDGPNEIRRRDVNFKTHSKNDLFSAVAAAELLIAGFKYVFFPSLIGELQNAMLFDCRVVFFDNRRVGLPIIVVVVGSSMGLTGTRAGNGFWGICLVRVRNGRSMKTWLGFLG